jgi:hypothetical protein
MGKVVFLIICAAIIGAIGLLEKRRQSKIVKELNDQRDQWTEERFVEVLRQDGIPEQISHTLFREIPRFTLGRDGLRVLPDDPLSMHDFRDFGSIVEVIDELLLALNCKTATFADITNACQAHGELRTVRDLATVIATLMSTTAL